MTLLRQLVATPAPAPSALQAKKLTSRVAARLQPHTAASAASQTLPTASAATQTLPTASAATASLRPAGPSAGSLAAGPRSSRAPAPLQSISSRLPQRPMRSLLFAATLAAAAAVLTGAMSNGNGDGATFAAVAGPRNVLGQSLATCSTDPMTGFLR